MISAVSTVVLPVDDQERARRASNTSYDDGNVAVNDDGTISMAGWLRDETAGGHRGCAPSSGASRGRRRGRRSDGGRR
jgi:hypothetical protein